MSRTLVNTYNLEYDNTLNEYVGYRDCNMSNNTPTPIVKYKLINNVHQAWYNTDNCYAVGLPKWSKLKLLQPTPPFGNFKTSLKFELYKEGDVYVVKIIDTPIVVSGGSRKPARKVPKVHIGPRGGKYVITNGKKKYLA